MCLLFTLDIFRLLDQYSSKESQVLTARQYGQNVDVSAQPPKSLSADKTAVTSARLFWTNFGMNNLDNWANFSPMKLTFTPEGLSTFKTIDQDQT